MPEDVEMQGSRSGRKQGNVETVPAGSQAPSTIDSQYPNPPNMEVGHVPVGHPAV